MGYTLSDLEDICGRLVGDLQEFMKASRELHAAREQELTRPRRREAGPRGGGKKGDLPASVRGSRTPGARSGSQRSES